jgi:glycosyltransferase involved in cell wall biosynthesis
MRRICIGIYFSSNANRLRGTLAHLRAKTPRSTALLLLADAPDAVSTLELKSIPDLLPLWTQSLEGPAACFNRLTAATSAEALVFMESGTVVPDGWLDAMLSALEADSQNGVILTANSDAGPAALGNTSIIMVRRDLIRAIGNAEISDEDAGNWLSRYCLRAIGAGFKVAHTDVRPEYVRQPSHSRSATLSGDRTRPTAKDYSHEWAFGTPTALVAQRLPTRANVDLARITVAAHFNIASGYGSMSEYLVRGMSRAGAIINLLPLSLNQEGLSHEFLDLLHHSRRDLTDPVLFYSWPEPALQPFFSRPELFLYTMWESSRLPPGWAAQINRACMVFVPSKFVAAMFRDSGVTVPLEVVPDGVDPEVYRLLARPQRKGITTLTVGPVDNRKNVLVGVAAWKQAFEHDPDARLIIKTQYNYQNYVPDDPRIRYVDMVENSRGILHWYEQADVLLALGSEGFGLPLIEGMATGLPVIALSSEGQGDVCQDAHDLLLPVPANSWEPYQSHFGSNGVHGVPAVSDVASRLRWVASHRDEAREMGRAASQWVLKNRNVWTKGPAVLDALEHRSRSGTIFRRATTFWVPSWESPCGIAEYAASLREALPGTRVSASEPDLRACHILHVEYHSGIFDQSRLLHTMKRAAHAGIPVVVTEHSVDQYARPWEQHARAIIALTSLGAARLTDRYPLKRVEYIPHGCPVWYPPRKTSRAKIIGAFGFLAHHKGFWRLLDALRQIPGAELLLFASAKGPDIEQEWREATQNLPVRRISEFLPAREIARRLAQEADVLAYWYDNVDHYSASGAVRIGLATGVPVLASATSWFHDLQDVTFQPPNLVDGLTRILEDTALRESLSEKARAYCEENSWPRVAEKHLALWNSLT